MEQLPPVTQCQVDECFYNREMMCHAPAINIGGEHPNCDTFIPKGTHSMRDDTGLVGACHVDQCRFNQDLSCHAASITVTTHNMHADCATFDPLK